MAYSSTKARIGFHSELEMLLKDDIQVKIAQLESTLKQIEANYNANIGALQVYRELLAKFDEPVVEEQHQEEE